MSDNNITTITNEDGQETSVNVHYNEDERPVLDNIVFFTVYKDAEYREMGEEGQWLSCPTLEAIYTVPFLYTQETLELMIESNKKRILGFMNEDEIFVGIETHYGQMSEI